MKIGIHLPQYGRAASAVAIRDAAVAAEELGFADVWVSDHIVHPAAQDYPSPYLFDPLLTLTWAAAATTTVGLATSVLVLPQYHPLWLANVTSSLDALSGGRLKLGVGVGWSEAEFVALGQDFHSRGKRTDEILEILSLCWSTDPASYHGAFYDFTNIKVQPKPAHSIDVWIGGSSPAAFQRARRFGSGFQLIGLKLDTILEPIEQLRSDHPDPDSYTIGLRTGWDPQGMDPDQILKEKEGFARAGVQHIVCAPWRADLVSWLSSMEQLAQIVIDGSVSS
jgi:probable F420-dependent oxidoreductase